MRKLLSTLVILCAFGSGLMAQYAIGHTTYTLTDPDRARDIPVEVFYPAEADGELTPVAEGKFPFLIVSHGFLMTYDAYAYLWEEYVPKGFIVVLPTTAGELFPDHEAYGRDIAFLSIRFPSLGKFPASPFFNKISRRCAAIGHSMGGGATILAASYPNRISTTITLAAAETSPSAISAATMVNAPSLLFAAGDDCVTPPGVHQEPIYEALASDCKTYISLDGGTHCQFADYNFNCSLGELFCGSEITRDEQQDLITSFLTPWLFTYLKNNASAAFYFNELLGTTEGISFMQSCSERWGNETDNEESLLIHPNPSGDNVTVTGDSDGMVSVFDLSGKQIGRWATEQNSLQLDVSAWPDGVYLVEMNGSFNKLVVSH